MRSQHAAVVDVSRAHHVLRHLPANPFTTNEFLNHAIGLNAVDRCDEVLPMLDHLVEIGAVVRTGEHAWLRSSRLPAEVQ